MAHAHEAGVSAAQTGTSHRTRQSFLPTTLGGWVVSILLYLAIQYPVSMLTGSAGLGVVPVVGNSMQSCIPWGSQVVVWPGEPTAGDYVLAWVDGNKGSPDPADQKPSLVVKMFAGDRLISTDDATVYDKFVVRGIVRAVIPVQRVCKWLNRGAQRPVDGAVSVRSAAELITINSAVLERQEKYNAIAKTLEKYKVREIPLTAKVDRVVAVVADRTALSAGMWIVDLGKEFQLVGEDDSGKQIWRAKKPVNLTARISGSPPNNIRIRVYSMG